MPVVDGLPVPVVRWDVAPRQPAAGPPEHPVDHRPVIGPTTTPLRLLAGQQRLQPGPFLIGQIVSIEHPLGLPHPLIKIRGTRSNGMTMTVRRVAPGGGEALIVSSLIGSWVKLGPRSGCVRKSVVVGRRHVVQPDDEIILRLRGPATLRLAGPPRTAAAAVRFEEFFTARAPPVGGHVLISNIGSKVCQRERPSPLTSGYTVRGVLRVSA